MSLGSFFFRGGKGGSSSFPIGFEFAPDGSLRLTGNATVFNDQLTNRITGDPNVVEYALASTKYEQKTDYAVYKNKVWIKTSLNPRETKTYKFVPGSGSANNKAVFLLYDDFDTLNEDTWTYQYGGLDANSHLKVNGGNNILGTKSKIPIPTNVVIEWNMYSKDMDFDSGIRLGPLYLISDKGTGNHSICTSLCYPNGSQQPNKWNDYQAILTPTQTIFKNLSVNKTVKSVSILYKGGEYLQFVCDSDTTLNPLLVDYICVRRYFNESDIDVSVTTDEKGNKLVQITNLSENPYYDIQVPIDTLPLDYYTVYAEVISPTFTTLAFPPNTISSISFFTQFNHSAKYDSNCMFHIHSFIPPDASPGKVKLKLEWETIPVEIINTGSEYQQVSTTDKNVKTIIKTFEITEDMIGKHVLLNFGAIDQVKSLSQIVFHRLTRLGTDTDDTFNSELPILYVDWHTEMDSIGSQEEFKK